MKILVYPHDLGIGGSQLNAIELAAAVQKLGHETIIFGQPGPLNHRIEELGLEFVPAPQVRRRPSFAAVASLIRLAESRGINILHGYEWPPSLECYLAAKRLPTAVAVSTVMSMAVAPFIPKHLPLTVGTPQIAAAECDFGRACVSVLEPPVDVDTNAPGLELGQEKFKRDWEIAADSKVVVMVSRLAHELKLEGILSAMSAVGALPPSLRVTLLIVGDGPASREVAEKAALINAQTRRKTVILTGALEDPRKAYDVADLCLGMGGSALRSLAFGKPLVVQGESGFWELLTPGSLDKFLWQGWYGTSERPQAGPGKLQRILARVLVDDNLRTDLGSFGLKLVRDRFSLTGAAQTQLDFYQGALAGARCGPRAAASDAEAASRYLLHQGRRIRSRLAGLEDGEDFNVRPVAAAARKPSVPARTAP